MKMGITAAVGKSIINSYGPRYISPIVFSISTLEELSFMAQFLQVWCVQIMTWLYIF